jgi:hypothetical protein
VELKNKNNNNKEVKKSVVLITAGLIEYVPNSVVTKNIVKKLTGNVTAMSFDAGEGLLEKTSPFDCFALILDGKAEIVIDGVSNILETGNRLS